jgi:hypothetical protein
MHLEWRIAIMVALFLCQVEKFSSKVAIQAAADWSTLKQMIGSKKL